MNVNPPKRVLVIGATGMLGSAIYRILSDNSQMKVFGTIRNLDNRRYFEDKFREMLIQNIDIRNEESIFQAFSVARPEVVINCVGIIKQLPLSDNHLESISINALLPHQLARHCKSFGARLIHFSTDCVFSGKQGKYIENDFPDADDLYGRTKFLGELHDGDVLTLRTSIIGHELTSHRSLVDWFLNQSGNVKGYRKCIFSGLPNIEIARILNRMIIPNYNLRGLYHLSVNPINKYDLLCLIAKIYKKKIDIIPDDTIVIDRSLISSRFCLETGFKPKSWYELISDMYNDFNLSQRMIGK